MTRATARPRTVLLAIVAAALVIRVVYFAELGRGPCLWQHRWPDTDMAFFDSWARTIVAGDWLGDRPLHPRHGWYQDVARAYFAAHPDTLAPGADQEEAAAALWDRWYGGKTFHQEPLYPYLLAITYLVLGRDVRWVFAWQMGLGVATVVLVYLLARRCAGERVAAVAGVLAALFAPALMYEMVLLRTTAATFAGVGIAYLVQGALERPTGRRWLLVGLASGVAVLLQSSLLVLPVGGLLLLAWHARARALPRGATMLAAGLALGLAPAVARNLAVGAPPLGLSSVGPVVFALSNTAGYRPESGFAVDDRELARILADTDGRALAVVRETLATHSGPGSVLRQLWGKTRAMWHWYELPNNTNFYYYRLHAPVLRWLPVTFSLLSPLGLLGLVLAPSGARRPAVLYLLLVAGVAPMLVFYVLSRFRVLAGLALVPFAALALVQIWEWAARRRYGPLAASAAALVGLTAWTWRPLPAGRPLIRDADYLGAYLAYYGPETASAFAREDWPRAVQVLADAVGHEPDAVRRTSGPGGPASVEDARFYGMVHYRYAEALTHAGDPTGAATEQRRAQELLRAGGVTLPAAP